ncbi:MAG: trigger factor [Lachnospiraceae bacterium]|nr:trigger factor [Lachnospiraceae bacterium]
MKKMRKCSGLLAALLTLSLAMSGCSTDGNSGTIAAESETEAEIATVAVEDESTEAAEDESTESDTDSASSGMPDYSAGLDDDGILTDIDAASLVTLPDYKNAVLSKSDVEVTDDDVQAEIDEILESYAETTEVTDRAVVDGDTVNIDYVGSIDGEEFDGGSTEGAGTDVTIGETSYIDDFLEQLIGHTPGETFDVEVTFPDPYENNTDLSGKDAVFETTINYITETTLPELTDEFVAENLAETYSCSTAEELTALFREDLEANAQYSAVWEYLMENCAISEVPDSLVEELIQVNVDYYALYISTYYSIELEDYLSYYGQTEDDLREDLRESAEQTAERYLIAQSVAEAEELVIDDDALTEYFGDTDYTDYVDYYGAGYVKMQVRLSRIASLIYETATLE